MPQVGGSLPPPHTRLEQLTGGHQVRDRPGRGGRAHPEVVRQAGSARDAQRGGGSAHQDHLRLVDVGSRGGVDRHRQDALRGVVEPLELRVPARNGQLTGREQPFQHMLGVRPVPPGTGSATVRVGHLARGDGAAALHEVANLIEQVGVIGPDPEHVLPGAIALSRHPMPQGGLQGHVDQTSRMSPVLEDAAWVRAGSPSQKVQVIGTHSGEEGHLVSPNGHIDRVDLQLGDPSNDLLELAHPHHLRVGGAESLGCQGDPPGLGRPQHTPTQRRPSVPPIPSRGGSRRSRRPSGGRPRWEPSTRHRRRGRSRALPVPSRPRPGRG